MYEDSDSTTRRSALRKGAIGAGAAGIAWAAPRVDGLSLRPKYASAQTGGGDGDIGPGLAVFSLVFDNAAWSVDGSNAISPISPGDCDNINGGILVASNVVQSRYIAILNGGPGPLINSATVDSPSGITSVNQAGPFYSDVTGDASVSGTANIVGPGPQTLRIVVTCT